MQNAANSAVRGHLWIAPHELPIRWQLCDVNKAWKVLNNVNPMGIMFYSSTIYNAHDLNPNEPKAHKSGLGLLIYFLILPRNSSGYITKGRIELENNKIKLKQ